MNGDQSIGNTVQQCVLPASYNARKMFFSLHLFSRPACIKCYSAMVDIAFKALREGDGFERLPP
jgi:hypothetical protein